MRSLVAMNFLGRSLVGLVKYTPSKPHALSFHSSPVAETTRWKRWQYTPWPWPLGSKNKRSTWLKHRPGYMKLRRDLPKPGSEEGQISGPYRKQFQALVYGEMLKLLGIFARQCEVYAAQRVRRAQQLSLMYGTMYSRRIVGNFLLNLSTSLRRHAPLKLTALMSSVVFAMDKQDYPFNIVILDEEIERCYEDLSRWSGLVRGADCLCDWESVTKTSHCDVWQKAPTVTSPLPEYRAVGTFSDIPAKTFYQTQMDVVHRKQWDKLVVKLDLIERDDETGAETLQWVSQFPFPFLPREYIYQRRSKIYEDRNAMIIISKSCDHPRYPVNNSYVRVKAYYSALMITPHRTFEEDGFDYVMSYVDDAQSILPRVAVQYAARTNLPEFMTKLHEVAKTLIKKYGRPQPTPKHTSPSPTTLITSVGKREKENSPIDVSETGGDVHVPSTSTSGITHGSTSAMRSP